MADEEQTAQVELEVAVGGEAEQEVTEEAKRSTSPSSSTSSEEEGDKGEEQPAEPQPTQEQEPASEPSKLFESSLLFFRSWPERCSAERASYRLDNCIY